MGDPGSDAYSFGPVISWAALDLGRVETAVRQADSRAQAQLSLYKRTVLEALEETENALVDHSNERIRTFELSEARVSSDKAAEIARQQFNEGLTDFLSVLQAEATALDTEEDLAVSRTRSATTLVEIYKTLGGGWEVFPIIQPGEEDGAVEAAIDDEKPKPRIGPSPQEMESSK